MTIFGFREACAPTTVDETQNMSSGAPVQSSFKDALPASVNSWTLRLRDARVDERLEDWCTLIWWASSTWAKNTSVSTKKLCAETTSHEHHPGQGLTSGRLIFWASGAKLLWVHGSMLRLHCCRSLRSQVSGESGDGSLFLASGVQGFTGKGLP